MIIRYLWRGDRVVDGTGLENRQSVKAFASSNLALSAIENRDRKVSIFYGGISRCLILYQNGVSK